MRLLAKAAPGRVKVFTIGTTEEGREMIAVAVGSEALISRIERTRRVSPGWPIRARSDERSGSGGTRAGDVPVYYITGHHPLAGNGRTDRADGDGVSTRRRRQSYIKNIRDNVSR